jgi:hypothetical protein
MSLARNACPSGRTCPGIARFNSLLPVISNVQVICYDPHCYVKLYVDVPYREGDDKTYFVRGPTARGREDGGFRDLQRRLIAHLFEFARARIYRGGSLKRAQDDEPELQPPSEMRLQSEHPE